MSFTFLYDDFEASYEHLLSKGGKSKMNVRRLRTSCVEIYKNLNDLNPSFMNDIFKLKINGREVRDKYKLILGIPMNQRTFGHKVLGPKIWNNLPYHVKSYDNLDTFKNLLKNWYINLCKCNLCKWYLLKSIYPNIICSVCFTFILETFYLISYVFLLKDYL